MTIRVAATIFLCAFLSCVWLVYRFWRHHTAPTFNGSGDYDRDPTAEWAQFTPFLAEKGLDLHGSTEFRESPLAPEKSTKIPFLPTDDEDFVYRFSPDDMRRTTNDGNGQPYRLRPSYIWP
ncbi:hypothetical protein C8R43DRAFT_959076 [Mycena crocata]|nr:hypothetical protein C8R43DRAFT_959076 [Mycena crocata]